MNPVAAEASIVPSMPMLTTPERSHHRPHMAPSAMGVLKRSDSTRSWVRLVSGAVERESPRTSTSGMKRSEDTSRLPLASRFDRPSKKVAMAVSTKMMPIAVTSVLGVKRDLQRLGRRLEGEAPVGLVEVRRHVADQEHAEEAEQHAEGLQAPEPEAAHVAPHPVATWSAASASRAAVALEPEDGPHDDVSGDEQQDQGLDDPDHVDREPRSPAASGRHRRASTPTGST